MIVMIDHIAFASDCLDRSRGAFESIGYELRFMERNLRDLSNKREFMKHFTGDLQMAFMAREGSIGIELVDHGHCIENETYVFPVLEGGDLVLESDGETFVFDEDCFCRVRSNSLQGRFFVKEGGSKGELRCNKVVVEASDLDRSVAFWGHLGFKTGRASEREARMEFRTPVVRETHYLYIRERKRKAAVFCLDSRGFNCLALITSDANRERKRFEALGIEASDLEVFRVNGKQLQIFWLRGPSGEIVEIIGLAR